MSADSETIDGKVRPSLPVFSCASCAAIDAAGTAPYYTRHDSGFTVSEPRPGEGVMTDD